MPFGEDFRFMQFHSVTFMVFFPLVLAVYFIIPKRLRMYWLLLASYYFYMSWSARYAILIGGSTVVTYCSALLFSRFTEQENGSKRKNAVLIACLCINLGILAIFKYGNFGIDSLNRILTLFGLSLIPGRLHFLLPVGISFYTFQALGYMIDVYRGDVEAEKNFFRYALFVSFFPQLVAGPIERSKNLLAQMREIETLRLWDMRRITSGAILMTWGFFMKMVIADRASILADTVFNRYRMYGRTELVLAVICFAIQIYCDFGSYSMIAIGAARIMGFRLMENFNAPFFSGSIREFWGRWHISLGTWFRDYLYIPLGGSRNGIVKKSVNTMIVFVASGLWHGANWSFVVWGALHGMYQVAGDLSARFFDRLLSGLHVKTDCFSWQLLRTVRTNILFLLSLIFFRADSVSDACSILKRIVTRPTPWLLFDGGIFTLGLDRTELGILLLSVVILFAVDLIRFRKQQMPDDFLFSQNVWFEWFVVAGLILMIVTFGEYGPAFDAKQFIYFQF